MGNLYCGSKLSEGTAEDSTIAFPEENNGIRSAQPGISLPGETPWRTLTVGDNLKPIVEQRGIRRGRASLSINRLPVGRSVELVTVASGSINYEDRKPISSFG